MDLIFDINIFNAVTVPSATMIAVGMSLAGQCSFIHPFIYSSILPFMIHIIMFYLISLERKSGLNLPILKAFPEKTG